MNPLALNNGIQFQHPFELLLIPLLIPLLLLALLAFRLQREQDELVRWKWRAHVAEARVQDREQVELEQEREKSEQSEQDPVQEDDVMVLLAHRAKRKAVDELTQEWRKVQEWRTSCVYSGGLHPGRAFLSTTNNFSKMGLIVFPMKYFICGIQLTPDDASFQFSRYSKQIARLAKMNNWVDLPEQNISNSPFLSLRAGHDLSRHLMDKEGSMEHI